MAFTNNDRKNTVIVQTASDLPDAVTGVITLEDGVTYIINGTIVLSDRIELGVSNTIIGLDKSDDKLVYTGTGNFISGTNQDATIGVLTLAASVGTLFNIVGDGTNNIELKELIIGSTKTIGSMGGFDNLIIRNSLFTGITTNGFTITQTTNKKILIVDNVIENVVGTVFDLGTSTSNIYHFDRNEFDIAAGRTGISGLTASGNPNITGRITNNTFLGAGTYLNNIAPGDLKWEFNGNSGDNGGISDSRAVGEMYMNNNTTATVITTINTYVKVQGAVTAGELQSFQVNTTPRELEYLGEKAAQFRIVVSLNATGESSNKEFTMAIAKNGTIITKSENTNTPDNARSSSWSLGTMVNLSKNDKITLWVKNISDTANITVKNLNLTIL